MYKFVEDAAAKLEPLAIVHASMSALSPVTERVSPDAQKHYSRLYVESPALVAILPVLSRVSDDKVEVVTRTCCLIVDKLCKIVEDPTTMIPIMSK